ncbi:MAG: hypothetical protein WA030_02930 [Candidatus Microsaccharimonas sp.]
MKLILLHNSDRLFTAHKPPDDSTRPFFYWYSDRFVSFQGTQKYLYIFVIDPKKDDVQLRSRTRTRDFDGLHKDFLHYKAWIEGSHDEECWCTDKNLKYAESGIAMTFSEMKPTVTLLNRYYGSNREEWMATDFEISEPAVPFTKRKIKLFKEPYAEMFETQPIKFNEIPEIVNIIPDINECLPFKTVAKGKDGKYDYEGWKPMISEKDGIWL